jgi:ABC-type multidrug transport system fused ATPase/permease subunit
MDISHQPLQPNSGPPTFSETTLARPWMRTIGALILVAALLIAAFLVFTGASAFHRQIFPLVAASISAAIGLVIGVVGILSRIKLDVDARQVTLGFWPVWQKKIPLDDIAQFTTADLNPAKFGGLGLRRVPGRTWGLLFTGGPGLSVSRKSDGATFYIRTDRAEEAIAAFRGTNTA